MTELLIVIMLVAAVVLGVLTYIKLRRATGGAPEERIPGKKASSPLPRELQELQIDQPKEDTFDHPGESREDPKVRQSTSDRIAS
jgi:hypothetical protein